MSPVNDTTAKNGTGYLRRLEKYQGGEGGGILNTTGIVVTSPVDATSSGAGASGPIASQIILGGRGINKSINVPTEKQDEDSKYGFFIGRTTEMTNTGTVGALIQEMLYNHKDVPISYSTTSNKSFVSGYGCGGNGQTYVNGDNVGQPTPGTLGCVCVFYFPGKPPSYPL